MSTDKEEYYYVTVSGDCISTIADKHGLDWQKVWNASQNAELRSARKNDPNKLEVGDRIWIPIREQNPQSRPINTSNKFICKVPKTVLRVLLKIGGQPIKNEKCVLVVKEWLFSDEKRKLGRTDGEGNVLIDESKDIKLSPGLHSAKLEVGNHRMPLIFNLRLSALQPHDTIPGVAQRLENLGYVAGSDLFAEVMSKDSNARPSTERLLAATRRFQRSQQSLPIDGKISKETMERLKLEHGS